MLEKIDVVIIVLNSAKTLSACIQSVQACRYPQELITIFYADGGSRDDSVRIAESHGARSILVDAEYPTPGGQRNAGWKAGEAPLVQFLDSDTILDPDWLFVAVGKLEAGLGAVCGDRREMHPERSTFNWIHDQEWNGKPGVADFFGGDVLIRREALESTGGYDPGIVAGEDPECAYRVRKAGYRILKLDCPMTRHDIAMYKVRQYWKRTHRSGYGFAEVHSLHRDFWGNEVARIWIRGGFFLLGCALLPIAFFSPVFFIFPVLGFFLLFRPRLLLVRKFMNCMSLEQREARIYAWHTSLAVVPQFFGLLRFHLGKVFRCPLRNKR